MIPNMTFKDYRDRINILQVLKELGYVNDRSKGRSVPSFVKKGISGEEDRVYVKNPQNPGYGQTYWRRGGNPGDLFDVIHLIRENIRQFPEYAGSRNDIDAINKVCARLTNQPVSLSLLHDFGGQTQNERPFNLEDFEREKGNWQKAMRFFKERGIDEATAELFKDNFELIRDTRNSKVSWKNVGFPYRRPGEADIVGYEVRGFGSYKSKAEGTDSINGCWQAYLGNEGTPDRIPAMAIEKIHIAESAYDIMAYVQLHAKRINFNTELFISVGGTYTNGLMEKIYKAYPTATPVLHFDNDMTGIMYDIRAVAIRMGRTLRSTHMGGMVNFMFGEKAISIPADELTCRRFMNEAGLDRRDRRPDIIVEKAPSQFKDWNEILQTVMTAEKTAKKYYNETPQRGTFNHPAKPVGEDTSGGMKR